MVSTENVNFKRAFRNIIKNSLRIKWPVIITYTGMVTADYQMCTTAVLTKYGVKYSFPGAGIKHVKTVDPYKLDDVQNVLKEAVEADEPAVVVSCRPCLLLKKGERGKPLLVSEDLCIGCGACLKLGCPGLEMIPGEEKAFRVRVNQVLCMGCGLCAQVCPKDAFMEQ